jgi:S-formylglutathione hydrolase FrmB
MSDAARSEPNQLSDDARGRLVRLRVRSAALGSTRTVLVHLPAAYRRSRRAGFPVVYLLRGHEREWANPNEDVHRAGRTAMSIADDLTARGMIEPLILVMPPITSVDGGLHGLGINLRLPARAERARGVGPGRFENFLVDEVIPTVDRRFRTRAERAARAVDGFSLGGFAGLSVTLRHPNLFASVGAFDGTFFYADGKRPDGTPDDLPRRTMFAAALGEPLDVHYLRRYNPADLVLAAPTAQLRRLSLHLHAGPLSSEPDKSNFLRTAYLLRLLAERGVRNSFEPFVLAGSQHNWFWADEHLRRSLPCHDAVFRSAVAKPSRSTATQVAVQLNK